ncbi:hypothetical protein ACFVIB_02175 [Streptomyces nigra]|uniref:hypothetical protein n=1 Tax=Streptomyces nigra TaxID=1827580 RepID=UPI00363F3340
MADPDTAGLVHEEVLDGVPDGEGRGLTAERVGDLYLIGVRVSADARRGDDEPAVGQAVKVRPAGSDGAQLGEFDAAVRLDGNDQRVKRPDSVARLRSVLGKQPVGGAGNVDGTDQDMAVMVHMGQMSVGNEGGLLHEAALLSGCSVTANGYCGAAPAVRERRRAEQDA